MYPYWILFAIFAVGAIDYRRRGIGANAPQPLLLVAGLFTALLIGFRYEVGGDWWTYGNIFQTLSYMDLKGAIAYGDPGYSLLNWLAFQLGFGIWFVNLVCALIFTWGCFRFAREQPNPWLAILVAVPYLIIVVAMGYTRQAVAIGFVMAGLAVLGRVSLLRFSVYILFAVAFHKSAVIVLPFVAMTESRNRLFTILMIVLMTASLYYLFVSSSIDRLVNVYVSAEYNSQGAYVRVLMNLLPACLYLIFSKRFGLPPTQQRLWRNFSIAAVLCPVALGVIASSTAVDRLALYLIPLQMFVLSRLPEIFPNRQGRNGQLVLVVIAYSALIQFVWLNYAANAPSWVPYQIYRTETA